MHDELIEKIHEFVTLYFLEESIELVELNIKHRGGVNVIDILADKPQGGITLDECSKVNRKLAQKFEEEQWFGDNYVLEVSSPGLDRPLKTVKDFLRKKGCNVRFHLLEKLEGKLEHSGEVVEASEDKVKVQTKSGILDVPIGIISKAVQVI